MGFCVKSLFCKAALCVLSSFAITPLGKTEDRVMDALLLLSYKCHALLLPRSAMGWSVVCEFGVSWSYLLTSRHRIGAE